MDDIKEELRKIDNLIAENITLLKVTSGYCQGRAEKDATAAEILAILRIALENNIQMQNLIDKLYIAKYVQ